MEEEIKNENVPGAVACTIEKKLKNHPFPFATKVNNLAISL